MKKKRIELSGEEKYAICKSHPDNECGLFGSDICSLFNGVTCLFRRSDASLYDQGWLNEEVDVPESEVR